MGKAKILNGAGLIIKNGITVPLLCADDIIPAGSFVTQKSISRKQLSFTSSTRSNNYRPNWVFVPKITYPENRVIIMHAHPYTMAFAYFDISSGTPVLLANVVSSAYYSMFYYCGAHQLSDGTIIAVGGDNYSGSSGNYYYNSVWNKVTLSDKSLTITLIDGMKIMNMEYFRIAFNFLDREDKTWIIMGANANNYDTSRILGLNIGLPFEASQRAQYVPTNDNMACGPLACWLNQDNGIILLMYSVGLVRHIITAQINDLDDSVAFNSDDTVIGSISSSGSREMPAIDIIEGITTNTFIFVTNATEGKVILASFEHGTYIEHDSILLSSYGTFNPCTTSFTRGRHLRKEGNFYMLCMNIMEDSINLFISFSIDKDTLKFINIKKVSISALSGRFGFSLSPVGKLITSSGSDTMYCTIQGTGGVVTQVFSKSSAIEGITAKQGRLGELVDVIQPRR